MEAAEHVSKMGEPSLMFDSFDVDMVIKVLSHTMFSPFFIFFIPVFYIFQGLPYRHPVVVTSGIYYLVLSLFLFTKWASRLYRNRGSVFFRPGRFDWGEQIVVVTGGASGMGELLANTLAVRNVTVIVLDVNPIITENYNIQYYKCDVSKWEEVQAVSKEIIEEIGQPTVLVNNAGICHGKLLVDLSPEEVQRSFSVNTLAHFYILKAFLPGMIKEKKGHIITMSSVLATAPACRVSDYAATKAAIYAMHDSLRYELDNVHDCPDIRTTVVLPGYVATKMFQGAVISSNPIIRFLCPVVQPITVIKAIITALDDQHSQEIFLPFYAGLGPYLRLTPSFVRDFFMNISGANAALEGFPEAREKGN